MTENNDEFNTFNPEDELTFDVDNELAKLEGFNPLDDLQKTFDDHIHLRIQKRNGRKTITIMEGFVAPEGKDAKDILKKMKTGFCCNGAVKKNDNDQDCYQLQGDHRQELIDFLKEKYGIKKEKITVHGF